MTLTLDSREAALWTSDDPATRYRLEEAIAVMFLSQHVVESLTVCLTDGEVLYSLMRTAP